MNEVLLVKNIEQMLDENNIEYKQYYILKALRKRQDGYKFSFNDHIRALVYSLLSNQRKWNQIEEHLIEIDEIFYNYDKEKILETSYEYFEIKLRAISCGNRNIHNQMLSLHENIRTFEKIEKEYGSLDSFVLSDTINNIAIKLSTSNSGYKLKQIGFALALEYLRNVGLDVGKQDLHIRRILSIKRLGYSKYEEAE